MKVLFIQPPKPKDSISMVDVSLPEPLSLEILAANLPGHEVKILDMRLEDDLENTLCRFNPDIVGTTAFTVEFYRAKEILKRVKEFNKDILTIIGGHHATFVPFDFYNEFIDIIVIGEGEYVIKEIVDTFERKGDFFSIKGIGLKINGNIKFTEARGNIEKLDEMPFPRRDLTEKYRADYFRGAWKPSASIYSSRGCPFRCDFCAMWKLYKGKFRMRSANNFVDELEGVKEEYVNFADDNTLHNVKFAEEVYEEIKKRGIKKRYKLYGRSDTVVKHPDIIKKWKEIGMDLLLVGLEAFRDEDLKTRGKSNTIKNNEDSVKILHENGVELVASFLVDPNFTEKDFNDLSNYVERLNLKHPIFTILTPFPGTDLYTKVYHQLTTHNYEVYDAVHAVLPTKLPLKEFYLRFIDLYKKAYAHSKQFLNDDMLNAVIKKLLSAYELKG